MAVATIAFLGFFLFRAIAVVFTVGAEHVGTTSGMTYFTLAFGNAADPLAFGHVADIVGRWVAWLLYVLAVYLSSLALFFAWLYQTKPSMRFST
ncbi:MAG: hypothetical protein QXQ48_06755 [Nitrososphaerota archaeon]